MKIVKSSYLSSLYLNSSFKKPKTPGFVNKLKVKSKLFVFKNLFNYVYPLKRSKKKRSKKRYFFRPKLNLFFSQFIFWLIFFTESFYYIYQQIFFSIWINCFFYISSLDNNVISDNFSLYKKNFYYSLKSLNLNKLFSYNESFLSSILVDRSKLNRRNRFLKIFLLYKNSSYNFSRYAFLLSEEMSSEVASTFWQKKKNFYERLRKFKYKRFKPFNKKSFNYRFKKLKNTKNRTNKKSFNYKFKKYPNFLEKLKNVKNQTKKNSDKFIIISDDEGFEAIPIKRVFIPKFYKKFWDRKLSKTPSQRFKYVSKRKLFFWVSKNNLKSFRHMSSLVSYKKSFVGSLPKVGDLIPKKKRNQLFFKKRPKKRKRLRAKLFKRGKTFVRKLKKKRFYVNKRIWYNKLGLKLKYLKHFKNKKAKLNYRFKCSSFYFGL